MLVGASLNERRRKMEILVRVIAIVGLSIVIAVVGLAIVLALFGIIVAIEDTIRK